MKNLKFRFATESEQAHDYHVVTSGGMYQDILIKSDNFEILEIDGKKALLYDNNLDKQQAQLIASDSLGGGAINCALAAAKLDGRVAVMGAIGDDDVGKWVIHEMKRAGIKFLGEKVVDGATAKSVVHIDKNGAKFAESYADLARRLNLKKSELLQDDKIVLPRTNVLQHSSLGLYNGGLSQSTYEANLQLIKAYESLGQLPKIVCNFQKSHLNLPKYFEEYLPKVDLIGFNKEEAQIFLDDSSIEDIIELQTRILEHPSFKKEAMVLITDGANGVWLKSKDDKHNYFCKSSFDVNVVDTTGAGDTVLGTMALNLGYKKHPVLFGLRSGVVNATQNIRILGANDGQTTRKQLNSLVMTYSNQIELKDLNIVEDDI